MPGASTAAMPWTPWSSNCDPHLARGRPGRKKEVPMKQHVSVWSNRPPPGAKLAPSAANTEERRRPEEWRQLSWEEHLKLLKQYVLREGNALIPLEHVEDGVRLGVWLSKQWSQWSDNPRGGYLSHARKLRLADAGVDWAGPAPPASGLVGPKYLNERKWDEHRSFDLAARQYHWKEFDAGKPACKGAHWEEYAADKDPHAAAWLRRQRSAGRTHEGDAPPSTRKPDPYIPYGHPPVKGLNMELAKLLQAGKSAVNADDAAKKVQHAKQEMEAERARRRKFATESTQK